MSSSTPLTLKPATPTPAAKKAVPTRAQLAPWDFDYRSAPDGKDANLLIMFHGLGESEGDRGDSRARCFVPPVIGLSYGTQL